MLTAIYILSKYINTSTHTCAGYISKWFTIIREYIEQLNMDDRGMIPGRNSGRFYLLNLVRTGCGPQSECTDFEWFMPVIK